MFRSSRMSSLATRTEGAKSRGGGRVGGLQAGKMATDLSEKDKEVK